MKTLTAVSASLMLLAPIEQGANQNQPVYKGDVAK